MDPVTAVGLLASVIQVIDATTTVIRYLNDVRKAPNDRARLSQEATNLLSLLITLRSTMEEAKTADPWFTRIRSLGVVNGPLDQAKEAMEELAMKLQPEPGLKKLCQDLMWTVDKKQCNEVLTKIERLKTLILLARQEDSFKLMQAIKAETTELPSRISGLQSSDNQRRIREWLKPSDPSSNHRAACKKRQATTGSWLLGARDFVDWMTAKDSFLWLHGIPGCGKTVLCSSIIEEITEHCQKNPTYIAAYFYFDFNDTDKQSHEKLIHSLAFQLSATSPEAQDTLLSLHARCQDGQQQPKLDNILEVIQQILQSSQHCYIVLDALDECKKREDLLPLIEDIMQWKLGNLHFLATSRAEKDISNSLEPLVTRKICIQSAVVNADIQVYTQERLRLDRELKKWPANVKAEIETTLLKGADGMFRWVVCQLDSLQKCLNLKKIRQELKCLPRTLDETYDRVLSRINEDGYFNEVFMVLQWLCFSARALRIKEMAEVLAIDLESCQFDPEQRFPEPRDILKVCSSLVTIAPEDTFEFKEVEVIRLAHFSVKEYLTGNRIQQGIMSSYSILSIPSHTIIGSGCLAYLLYFKGANILTKESLLTYPLGRYAARYWTYHAQMAMDQDVESEELTRLKTWSCKLLQTDDCFLSYIRLFDPVTLRTDFGIDFEDVAPPLYYISFVGLNSSVKLLLDRGADVNAVPSSERYYMYGTALAAAAGGGREIVVRQLLEAGADVNAATSGTCYGTALAAAAGRGHKIVVRQLLEAGADVNTPASGAYYGTALAAAADGGHEMVVRQLLEAGADVNARASGNIYGTALAAAAGGGHEMVVRQLLEAGAEVNAPASGNGTALAAAAGEGHEMVVRQLLEAGADVNAPASGAYYGTALAEAAGRGHEIVVRQLLEAGADVNAPASGAYYGTAMAAAAGRGHKIVVRQLLEAGADVNALASGNIYSTALAAAAEGGHKIVVRQLLEAGADVNAATSGTCYGTALAAAAGGGHEMVVRQLLEAGADVNAATSGAYYGTALAAAVGGGHERVVRLLSQADTSES